MRQTIMQTYQELMNVQKSFEQPGKRIYFEYVSKYRRILVLEDGKGFTLECTYKGLDLKPWSKNYGDKDIAIAWAKAAADNRSIIVNGILTITEAPGKQIDGTGLERSTNK